MKNLLYRCLKCGARNVYENGNDGVLCKYCHGYLELHGETEEKCFDVNVRELERYETPCMYEPIYCMDKDTGEIFLVTSIELPLYSPSGKDITVKTLDGHEWRSITDVTLLEIKNKKKKDRQKEKSNNDKIVIELNGATKPPKVLLDGKKVVVKELDYSYVTDTDIPGTNELLITYQTGGRRQFDKIGFESFGKRKE